MEYRNLGGSGLKVPAVTFGAATFGGGNEFFRKWGNTDVKEAISLIAAAMEMGCNMFDTADAYSAGLSEQILGKAVGYIDLYQLHSFDALTPIEEMLQALDVLMRTGKIRYFGVSNYSGWHLMKMVSVAEMHSLPKPVTHQVYYTLTDRDFEWELMPLGMDQNIRTLVWSPLAGAKLGGKVGRNKPPAAESRASTDASWQVPEERLFAITDVLESVAVEVGHSIPRVALAWLLSRPTISSIVIGARNIAQLQDNLAATEVMLAPEQITRLDRASEVRPAYPYWHQRATFLSRNPSPVRP